MNELKISVVVCTYNRAKYLEKCIDSLIRQDLSPSSYEIIVVDNNSSDNTKNLCDRFQNDDNGNFRYFLEASQGLSYARNRGFRESRAPIVAYIDDDAVACQEWLERLVKAFSLDEQIVAVGGKVEPVWEIEKPNWISSSLYTYFSCIDWGDEPFFLKKGAYLYGCNMAFRKDLLLDCGGFVTALGRIGNNLLSNEEWKVFKYIDQRGLKKYYNPEIFVEHTIISSRISWKWLKSRLYWQGVSNLYYDYLVEHFTKVQLLNKYTREMTSFFSRELSQIVHGRGNEILLRLFVVRYVGTILHFIKICLGLTKRG